jgi:hypothetical protein
VIGEAIAAAAHVLGGDATRVLERIGGAIGAAARSANDELGALDRDSARRRRAEWAAAARAPVPAGMRAIDPSWIEHALGDLPERARDAIAGAPGDPVDVWLARTACAALCPMTARDRELAELLARPAPVLVAWLVKLGGDIEGDDLARIRAGARTIAPRLARHALAARQLAQRLPRPLGLVVERDLQPPR